MSLPDSVTETQLLDAARAYAARGWRVFPLRPGTKVPHAGSRGFRDATTDEAAIEEWWRGSPQSNIGVATGIESFDALDVDAHRGGEDTIARLEAVYGELPAGPRQRTPNGGRHLLYRGATLGACGADVFGVGLDVRGEGGYIVAAPSVLSGRAGRGAYVFEDENEPLPEPPVWLVALDKRKRGSPSNEHPSVGSPAAVGDAEARAVLRQAGIPLEVIPKGRRDDTLFRHAASLRARWAEPEAMLRVLRVANMHLCQPPLSDAIVVAKVRSAAAYPAGPTRAGDAEEGRGPRPLTDLGNAERLVAAHGRDLRYIHSWRAWLVWDGTRWRRDERGAVIARMGDTARCILHEAAEIADLDARKALGKWALRSESAERIRAAVGLAASQPGVPVTPDELDADPWLLNCANGALDLRTFELRPHRREDLCTRQTPVAYDPRAEAPRWLAFLERVVPDRAVCSFLARAVGYALSGDTTEQAFFVLWGSGANGKSTFTATVLALLGDYGLTTPPETLLATRDTGIPNDVARLRGARFVAAVEAEEGRRLAEARVKQLTGGDTISARYMRGEWFDFVPQFKLWLSTNHRPAIRGTDDAIWRRLRLVPFTVSIPPSERDRALPERLRRELPGVLAWAVDGARQWRERGLDAPTTVTEATSEYRETEDALGTFLTEACAVGAELQVMSRDLYAAYSAWCHRAGEQPLRQRDLGVRLQERGFQPERVGKERSRAWRGIGLIDWARGRTQDAG